MACLLLIFVAGTLHIYLICILFTECGYGIFVFCKQECFTFQLVLKIVIDRIKHEKTSQYFLVGNIEMRKKIF